MISLVAPGGRRYIACGGRLPRVKEKPYKFVVRLPAEMRERIADAARHYRRSMNSEIVARLHQSLSGLPDARHEEALSPPLHPQLEQILKRQLSLDEEAILESYRRLSEEKQQALRKLLG